MTENEQRGVELAESFDWSVEPLLEVIQAALEESNCHSLNTLIDQWKAERGFT